MTQFPVIDFSFARFTFLGAVSLSRRRMGGNRSRLKNLVLVASQLDQLKAAGVTGFARYQDVDSPGKAMNQAEFDLYRSKDFQIIPIYEDHADDYLKGPAKGAEIGRIARDMWGAVGIPDNHPIIFGGYDTGDQMNPANQQKCIDFMGEYSRNCGNGQLMPCYSGTKIGEIMVSAGVASWIWMAAASSWSPAGITPHVHMKQTTANPYPFLPAGSYDANEVIQPFYAQFPAPQGEDMAAVPYSLWSIGTINWRVAGDTNSKVRIADATQLQWNKDLLAIAGFDSSVHVANTATLQTWLNTIPDATLFDSEDEAANAITAANAAKASADAAKAAADAAKQAADAAKTAVLALPPPNALTPEQIAAIATAVVNEEHRRLES